MTFAKEIFISLASLYLIALGACWAWERVRKRRQDRIDLAEVERILEAWAVIERRKRSSTTGRFRRTYGHFDVRNKFYGN